MSCKAMGGIVPTVGTVAAVTLYGCGPNVIVGGVGAVAMGVLAVKDSVHRQWLERKLTNTQDEEERTELATRIKELSERGEKFSATANTFAKSTIPIIGPWMALLS